MALDLDHLKNKRARRQSSGWSPKEGDNLIRILPPSSLAVSTVVREFDIEFRSHFLKAEGSDTQVKRCLRDKKEICPFCVAAQKFRESENPSLKKNAEQIRSSERHLMNILNLNDVGSGIQTFETGPMIYDAVLEYLANPAWGDLTDVVVGRNITLVLTPQSKSRSGFNSYSVQPHPSPTDIRPNLPADWAEKLDALPQGVPEYPTQEEIDRWLNVLGMAPVPLVNVATASVVSTSVVPASPLVVSAAAPTVASFAPMPAPIASPEPVFSAPAGTDEVSIFAAKHGLGIKLATLSSGGPRNVPQCFSEGTTSATTGFNPQAFPCEKGCPVRADCQLRKLGLA